VGRQESESGERGVREWGDRRVRVGREVRHMGRKGIRKHSSEGDVCTTCPHGGLILQRATMHTHSNPHPPTDITLFVMPVSTGLRRRAQKKKWSESQGVITFYGQSAPQHTRRQISSIPHWTAIPSLSFFLY
jgi:hypothetical protein